MRICLIGKFPPIQGGVSMRTYWAAHGLAARGHEIHVVTNAKEASPPFRMHMRPEDWRRCEADYDGGSVTVHWTDPIDRSQAYIPMASPFVSKLAAIAARVHSERPFDAIFSFYLEPYGVAAYLAAQMTGAPHVVRMAGSDAGRLWHHPQFEALYDHVLRSAEVVIAGNVVAARAVRRGVEADRIAFAGGVVVPESLFAPDGPALDIASLRAEVEAEPGQRDLLWGEFAADQPYFGVYGKLGESKGSFALLAAMHRLKRAGLEVGLVALAHGPAIVEESFRVRARKLGLTERILQIPFLPHWRVPEFLRGCLAVCCLEQDFPIGFHSPIIPREVLLCGTCLVASTEVIRKLPGYGGLPHGYGCVAIEDVNDVETLSDRLAAIVKHPGLTVEVGVRGREFARELQRNVPFPQELEHAIEAAVARQRVRRGQADPVEDTEGDAEVRFRLTRLAAAEIATMNRDGIASGKPDSSVQILDLARAREVLSAVGQRIADGDKHLCPLVPAVQAEIAVAAAEREADEANLTDESDPLFRLQIGRWAMGEGDLPRLMCVRDPRLRLLAFDFDVSALMAVRTVSDLAVNPTPQRSYMVAFGESDGHRREPLVVDELTASILALSDGTRTALEIVEELNRKGDRSAGSADLEWIERLFVHGLISLRDKRPAPLDEVLLNDSDLPRERLAGQGPTGPEKMLPPVP